MKKNSVNQLIIASIAILAAFISCSKDDNGNENGKVKLLKTVTFSYGDSIKYEYDSQNRLTKYSSFHNNSSVEMYEFTYNAEGNLVKQEFKSPSPQLDYTEVYVKSGNTITITVKRSGLTDRISTLDLNSNGYPVKREEFYGEATNIRTFTYKDDNLIKISDTRLLDNISRPLNDSEYAYDNNKETRYNCKTPKWFMVLHFGVGGSKNNITNSSNFVYNQVGENGFTKQLARSTDYTWEYDNDRFPIKRTSTEPDNTVLEILFGYK